MKCPIDGNTLVLSDRRGIEIDYCPECRGVWLDRGELDKIIERSTQASVAPMMRRDDDDWDDDDEDDEADSAPSAVGPEDGGDEDDDEDADDEDDGDEDDDLPEESGGLPLSARNYMTPAGFARMRGELETLMRKERPEVVKVVSWAASNGDRSENGDYIYGKKRLREIDRRIRFLNKRLESAIVVDNLARKNGDADTQQVFFGATVTYAPLEGVDAGKETIITIVGVDEVDLEKGHVSWVSPIAKALIKARLGDCVVIQTPTGPCEIEILDVQYL